MENFTDNKSFNLLHLFKLSKLFECDICEFFKVDESKSEQILEQV